MEQAGRSRGKMENWTDLDLCNLSKDNFKALAKEHRHLQKDSGPLSTPSEAVTNPTGKNKPHKAMFVTSKDVEKFLQFSSDESESDSSQDGILYEREPMEVGDSTTPNTVTTQESVATASGGRGGKAPVALPTKRDTLPPKSSLGELTDVFQNKETVAPPPPPSPKEKTTTTTAVRSGSRVVEEYSSSLSSIADSESEGDVEDLSEAAINGRIDLGYGMAKGEISSVIRSVYIEAEKESTEERDVRDPRISQNKVLLKLLYETHFGPDEDAPKRRVANLREADDLLARTCLHYAAVYTPYSMTGHPNDPNHPVYSTDFGDDSRKPLFQMTNTVWIMFVCAVVYEACRQGRERACLKENPKALTSVDHPVLLHCTKRDAFEDFFNGVENEAGSMKGIRNVWRELEERVTTSTDFGNPGTVYELPLSPVSSIISVLRKATSVAWCESTVPGDSYYCAMTGAKLTKGDMCYACNIRAAIIFDGDIDDDDDDDDANGPFSSRTSAATVRKTPRLPKREIRDNPFLIGHGLENTPFNWKNNNPEDYTPIQKGGAEPFHLFQLLVSLLQCDLAIKKAIANWLDAETRFLPLKNDPLSIANALTSDSGIGNIVDWFTYLFHLCYLVDTCLPPAPDVIDSPQGPRV